MRPGGSKQVRLITPPNGIGKLRMAFEPRAVRVPGSRVIREDLHSVSRVASLTGPLTHRAPYKADGHADRCTALALARGCD